MPWVATATDGPARHDPWGTWPCPEHIMTGRDLHVLLRNGRVPARTCGPPGGEAQLARCWPLIAWIDSMTWSVSSRRACAGFPEVI